LRWNTLQSPFLPSSQCLTRTLPLCVYPSLRYTDFVIVQLLADFRHVTVSPSPQSKDEENEKLHKLREYARDFRRQHTTDAEQFDWDSDDGDYGLAIGRLVVT
jgi:hypothetical protein